jgi:hypothetical protein
MDLRDATLMMLAESDDQPAVAALARSVYDQLGRGEEVGYQQLDALIAEASGEGVLRALHARHSPLGYQSVIGPILAEIDRQKPVPPRRRPDAEDDPLRAGTWPPPR